MKRHGVRGFQHGTDVPARSAPFGIGSTVESKEKETGSRAEVHRLQPPETIRLPRNFREALCWQDLASGTSCMRTKPRCQSALPRGRSYPARLSLNCRRAVNRAGMSTGFEIWAFIPASSGFSTSSSKASADTAMMGTLFASSCARERMRVASRPSMRGSNGFIHPSCLRIHAGRGQRSARGRQDTGDSGQYPCLQAPQARHNLQSLFQGRGLSPTEPQLYGSMALAAV